jgi:hypothetical protein
MPTLILPPRITPDTDAILEAAQVAGWEALRPDSWRIPDRLKGRDVVLYGEPLFADVVAPSLGVALLQAAFDWLPGLSERYRRRQVTFTALAAAREYPQPVFVKPADDKCFTARVYANGAELPDTAVLPDETPVLISQIVTWQVEYRCFVADRAVVTCSPYWRDGALAQAEDGTWPTPPGERDAALAFAHSLLADPAVAVPPAFVLDVGLIADRGWAVVEANSAWGAGIYGSDPALVLQVLRRAVVPQDRLPPDDLPWARVLPAIEMDAPPGMPEADADGLVTLYRPIGAYELEKIAASGYHAFRRASRSSRSSIRC